MREPFNVNAAAIVAGAAALDDKAFIAETRAVNDRMLPYLSSGMRELGYRVFPSIGNFVLVSFPPHSAEEVRLFLKDRGVLVRQMGAYGLADCLRITVGTQQDMDAVLDGVRAFQLQAPAEE